MQLQNVSMDVAEYARLFHTCGAAELTAHDAIIVLVLGLASRSFPGDRIVRDGL